MLDLPDLPELLPILGVFPVLVGPLQTLLALLPAILVGVGSMLLAVFKPGGFVRLLRFCWRQKLFLAVVAAGVVAWRSGLPTQWLRAQTPGSLAAIDSAADPAAMNWSSARGGPLR